MQLVKQLTAQRQGDIAAINKRLQDIEAANKRTKDFSSLFSDIPPEEIEKPENVALVIRCMRELDK